MTKFTPVIEHFSTIAGFLPENIMTPCHHHRWYLHQIFGYFRLFYDSGKHRANYLFLFIISWEGKSPLLNVKNVDPSAGVASTAPGRWLANTLYRTSPVSSPSKKEITLIPWGFLNYQFRIVQCTCLQTNQDIKKTPTSRIIYEYLSNIE